MMVSRLVAKRSSLLSIQTDSPRPTRVGKRSAGRDRRNAWRWFLVGGVADALLADGGRAAEHEAEGVGVDQGEGQAGFVVG
jgi:hypothetical protein